MSGTEVRLALRVFLGLPMPTIARQYSVACPHYRCREVSVDGFGHHFLAACPGGARLRTSLHHSLVKILQRTVSTAGYIMAREPPLAELLRVELRHCPPLLLPTGDLLTARFPGVVYHWTA